MTGAIKLSKADGTTWVDLDNGAGLEATFSGRGAGVYSLRYHGERLNLVLSDPAVYLTSPQFFGKTLGRVAGRIPCDFAIDGSKLRLPEDRDGFCLHGGKLASLSFQEWTPTITETADAFSVAFTLLSPAGDCGFPGNLKARVVYSFPRDGSAAFTIRFAAEADQTTPVSFSNHIYWDLQDDNDVSRQRLWMNADRYGTGDGKSQLITGIAQVPEAFDFRTGSALGPKLDVIERTFPEKTIDHTFLYAQKTVAHPQTTLENDRIRVSLFTDLPAMNIYVDSSKTPVAFANGAGRNRRRGIALEPQLFPLDHGQLLLKPGQTYSGFIRYLIESK